MKTKLLLSLIVFTAVALTGCIPSEVRLDKLTNRQLEQRAENGEKMSLAGKLIKAQALGEIAKRNTICMREMRKQLEREGINPLRWPIL